MLRLIHQFDTYHKLKHTPFISIYIVILLPFNDFIFLFYFVFKSIINSFFLQLNMNEPRLNP